MGFESGSVSFRMYYLSSALPAEVVRKFAKHAAPPIDTLGDHEVNGWVTGRHLLDRHITEETAFVAGYLRLSLMKAEKKVPDSLFRAECRMEELAQMEAEHLPGLNRAQRTEIRRQVRERLLPNMPPTLTGIPVVIDVEHQLVYAGTTSDKQSDAFIISFRETTGVTPIPLTPETACLNRRGKNANDLDPTSFSPEIDDGMSSPGIGQDFLTWLWFFSEARGGILSLEGQGQFGVILEGPLVFVLESSAAQEAVLRKGTPLASAESKTALLGGKRLRAARVTMAKGEQPWTTMLDANSFIFRGLKLPETESMEPVGRFQERILAIETFRDAFLGFYDRFVDERFDAKHWKATQQEIHRWVTGRTVRR